MEGGEGIPVGERGGKGEEGLERESWERRGGERERIGTVGLFVKFLMRRDHTELASAAVPLPALMPRKAASRA